jgi:hypothetical protein
MAGVITSGHEDKPSTLLGLQLLVEELEDSDNLPYNWILDGGVGLRDAVTELYTIHYDVRSLRIAMCFYHVVAALQLKKSNVPNFSQFMQEFYMLAELPVEYHERAVEVLDDAWRKRGGDWVNFADYFKSTWIVKYPGWWLGYLPRGSTRVSHESPWRLFHALIGKAYPPHLLAQEIGKTLIMFFVNNPTRRDVNISGLTLSERQLAVELAISDAEKVIEMSIDGEIKFLTKKKILGIGRPNITKYDYQALETAREVMSTHLLCHKTIFYVVPFFS